MKEVFRIAITSCGEIDADGEYSDEYYDQYVVRSDESEQYYELIDQGPVDTAPVYDAYEWNQFYDQANPYADNKSENSYDEL